MLMKLNDFYYEIYKNKLECDNLIFNFSELKKKYKTKPSIKLSVNDDFELQLLLPNSFHKKHGTELANVLKALSGYLNAAAKRFDWYAQGVVFGSSVPRDYAIAMLQRVLDNDWFFTGLTDSKPVQDCIESAKNQAASYPVQLTILDSYAKEIVSPEALSASARLIKLLKNLIAEMRLVGSSQLRMQLLKKIELYFDKAMVPALKVPKFDVQKNAWSL